MTPSFRQILEILNQHHVEYIVVGGVAAVIHGAPMTTFDLDTLVRVERANAEQLIDALAELDARFREHRSEIKPSIEDVLAGGHLLLMTNAGPLDVLGFIGDHERYDDLIDATTEIRTSMGPLRVLNLEALIEQKKRMDRPKDRAAIELLEAVLQVRRQQDSSH